MLPNIVVRVLRRAANFSGHYLVETNGMTAVQAGLASSLMPLMVVFCAPLAGLVLDKCGGQLYVLVACTIGTLAAYMLLVSVREPEVYQANACTALCFTCLCVPRSACARMQCM